RRRGPRAAYGPALAPNPSRKAARDLSRRAPSCRRGRRWWRGLGLLVDLRVELLELRGLEPELELVPDVRSAELSVQHADELRHHELLLKQSDLLFHAVVRAIADGGELGHQRLSRDGDGLQPRSGLAAPGLHTAT